MAKPINPNTAKATATVIHNARERQAAKLRAAGWTVIPPKKADQHLVRAGETHLLKIGGQSWCGGYDVSATVNRANATCPACLTAELAPVPEPGPRTAAGIWASASVEFRRLAGMEWAELAEALDREAGLAGS